MKKLTILLLLFLAFAFAEWDVDPDHTDLTVGSLEVEKLAGDTIINTTGTGGGFIFSGDTTAIDSGGVVIRQANNRIELWNDTLWFKGFHPSIEYGISTDTGKIYVNSNTVLALSHSSGIDFLVPHGTTVMRIQEGDFHSFPDTMVNCGTSVYRWSDGWFLRGWISSPNKDDSAQIYYDPNDTLHIEAEDGDVVKINNELVVNGAISGGLATITATADDVSIDSVFVLNVNTAGGNVTIGSFTGGVANQVLHIYNSATNNIILEDDEGTAGQDIKTNSAGDITITAEGGATLVCDGSLWYIIGIAQ